MDEDEQQAVNPDEVEVKTNDVDTGKVITAQPIPEDTSETEEKKRSNMVGRGEYVYTPKATTASAYRWDERCGCNCGTGGDAECCNILLGCLLCACLFGDGSGGGGGGGCGDCGDCGDCFSACDCSGCDWDCGNCDFD